MQRTIRPNGPGRLIALAAAAACIGALSVATPAAEKLTEFQWALTSRGALLFIPVDGVLYPARLSGTGEIETQPVRISVTLHETGQKMTPVLQSVVSPFELDPARWVAQKKVNDKWIDVETFVFVDGRFYLKESASTFSAVDPALLRFAPAKAR